MKAVSAGGVSKREIAATYGIPFNTLCRWVREGYSSTLEIAPPGPPPKAGVFYDALIAGFIKQNAVLESALNTKEIRNLLGDVFRSLDIARNSGCKDESSAHRKLVSRLKTHYDFVKRSPQLYNTARKRALAEKAVVQMMENFGNLCRRFGYLDAQNEWTEEGRRMILMCDESGGKVVTSAPKVFTVEGVAARKAKVATSPHITVFACHDLNFKVYQCI